MHVLAVMCFVVTATAQPIASTTITNQTNDLSAEKISVNSTHLPESFENLNQANISNVDMSVKPDDSTNISKEYHDGRGDTPPHDLDSYEEQQNREKGSTIQANAEPTLENEKLYNNVSSKLEESQSTSIAPITEANTLVENTTSANYTATTEIEVTTPSVTTKSLTKEALQNQQTTTIPLYPLDIQHNSTQLKEDIFWPASKVPQITQVPEKQNTSLLGPKSYSKEKDAELKIDELKSPSSIVQPLSGSQKQGNLLETQNIASTNSPKSDTLLKGELKSVGKSKPLTKLPSYEGQQNGQSFKKQEIKPSNSPVSGHLASEYKTVSDDKVSPSSPVNKSHRKEQAPKRKDKKTSLLSMREQKGHIPVTNHIIPLPESKVLQKERESYTKKINPAIIPAETKQIGYDKNYEPEAGNPVFALNRQQYVPGRGETYFLKAEKYYCEERYPWFNMPIPLLLFGNEIQVPVVLSPIPTFVPFRKTLFFKHPLRKYHNFVIV